MTNREFANEINFSLTGAKKITPLLGGVTSPTIYQSTIFDAARTPLIAKSTRTSVVIQATGFAPLKASTSAEYRHVQISETRTLDAGIALPMPVQNILSQ